MYVLRELLRDRESYAFQFIIRQVGTTLYVIDLEDCKGYIWAPGRFLTAKIVDRLQKTLYLYEPGGEYQQSPMHMLALPSLATLSPYNE